ncbi:unnamed protein product [Clonostachys byssicola]|uniref:Methyltransferase domain-containing protein n=1 Tax=Clonostachys byssicola TaxID=160290 RepID=A0A9N9UX02_9HYPO|nr:unnamed protein product [Clonostachys byssicola]
MAPSVYTLNSGDVKEERDRLDWQYDIFKAVFEGKLLPVDLEVQLKSADSLAIADVATGTGVWLRDLARQLPSSARLDGYDYDTSKFPAEDTVPSNIKFHFADALQPFPDHLHGTYDVVHIRLMMYSFRRDELQLATKHVRDLLKPGGWLVWEDTGYNSWTSLPMGPNFASFLGLDFRYATHVGRDTLMPLNLKSLFENEGFVNCSENIFSMFKVGGGKETGGMVTIRVARQSLMGMVEKGGFEAIKTEDDVEKTIHGLLAELNQGHRMGMAMSRIVGQRPKQE